MTSDKLNQIIADKNERLERSAVDQARRIIDEIAEYQQAKVDAETKIASLREELKKIEVVQINAASILGN